MKPLKLLACLVTLHLTCGLTLKAAETHDFRPWTDANGRTITARLLKTIDADSVQIERQDGHVFTVPLKTFSAADQAYVQAVSALTTGLKPADARLWTLLETGGHQPASAYSDTGLDLILETINQRFTVRDLKTASGQPLRVRTEPADLAARIKLSGELPRMSVAAFIKQIAGANNLLVASDAAGMIVLYENSAADNAAPEFLGIKLTQH